MAGWFRVEHEALALIEERCARRLHAIGAYTVLLRMANERRAETFEASRREVASRAGMSVDALDRAVRELSEIGLATREKGRRGGVNVWTIRALGCRSQRQGVPPRAVGGAAPSGSTRARHHYGGTTSASRGSEDVEDELRPVGEGGCSECGGLPRYVGPLVDGLCDTCDALRIWRELEAEAER